MSGLHELITSTPALKIDKSLTADADKPYVAVVGVHPPVHGWLSFERRAADGSSNQHFAGVITSNGQIRVAVMNRQIVVVEPTYPEHFEWCKPHGFRTLKYTISSGSLKMLSKSFEKNSRNIVLTGCE